MSALTSCELRYHLCAATVQPLYVPDSVYIASQSALHIYSQQLCHRQPQLCSWHPMQPNITWCKRLYLLSTHGSLTNARAPRTGIATNTNTQTNNDAKEHVRKRKGPSQYTGTSVSHLLTCQMRCPCEPPPSQIICVQCVLDEGNAPTPQLMEARKQLRLRPLPHFARQITNLRKPRRRLRLQPLQASTPGGGCVTDDSLHPAGSGAQQLPPQPHWDCSSRGRRGLHPAAAPLTSCVRARSDRRYVESDPLPSLQAVLHSSAALMPRRLGERPCSAKRSSVRPSATSAVVLSKLCSQVCGLAIDTAAAASA